MTYALTYHNRGSVTAEDVKLVAQAHYGLQLLGGAADRQVITLGDVAAGGEANVTLHGVTGAGSAPWAALDLLVYDQAHPEGGPPVEWVWIDHPLDTAAPTFYGIQAPDYLVPTSTTTLSGYAYDASGVSAVALRVQTPANGVQTRTCTGWAAQSGGWSCPWDLTALNGGTVPKDGDAFGVQIRATDIFGQVGAWSSAYPFVVDSVPPVVALNVAPEQQVAQGTGALLVRETPFALRGTVEDNRGLGEVVVCESGVCAPADVQLDPGPADVVVDDVPVAPAVTGGGTACIERTFVVTDALAIGEVRVGLTISHTHRDDLVGVLTSPANTQVEIISPDGRDAAANYDVLLSDAASSALHSGRGDDPGGACLRAARPSVRAPPGLPGRRGGGHLDAIAVRCRHRSSRRPIPPGSPDSRAAGHRLPYRALVLSCLR